MVMKLVLQGCTEKTPSPSQLEILSLKIMTFVTVDTSALNIMDAPVSVILMTPIDMNPHYSQCNLEPESLSK